MATWPLRDRKPAQVAERGEGGGEGVGEETESEGGIRSLGWMRETRQTEQRGGGGGGVNRRRRQASFLIKTDHSQQP